MIDPTVSSDQVAIGLKTLAHDNESNLEHYKNIIKNLLAVLREPDLHWRYQVIAITCLAFTIRKVTIEKV